MPHRTTRHGSTGTGRDAPWLVSMAMWSNYMQHVRNDGTPVRELARRSQATAAALRLVLTRMSGWWGYLIVSPDPSDGRQKPPRADWLVRPTPAGPPRAGGVAAADWRRRAALARSVRRRRGRSRAVDAVGGRQGVGRRVARVLAGRRVPPTPGTVRAGRRRAVAAGAPLEGAARVRDRVRRRVGRADPGRRERAAPPERRAEHAGRGPPHTGGRRQGGDGKFTRSPGEARARCRRAWSSADPRTPCPAHSARAASAGASPARAGRQWRPDGGRAMGGERSIESAKRSDRSSATAPRRPHRCSEAWSPIRTTGERRCPGR